MERKSSSSCSEVSASVASSLSARLRSISQLPNHSIVPQLLQLNQQNRRLEAELLLYLGELDRRQIYREQAVASAFEFCVLRLGYSEDVAFKRVGAARLLRRFPLIYDLLVDGRIHLTALMLIKPHLTEENYEEWLFLASEKSKRQVEKLVAARCPRPDVPASIRKLPDARPATLEAHPQLVPPDRDEMRCARGQASGPTTQTMKAQPLTALASTSQVTAALVSTEQVTATRVDHATAATVKPPATRIAPLSSRTYRVTFTASERLKQKLDRASELLSHCIRPSNLPALVERALDQLLEREEKRRYGARSPSNPQSVEPTCGDNSTQAARPSSSQSVQLAVGFDNESCQEDQSEPNETQDPDLARALNPACALDPARARAGHGSSNASSLDCSHPTGTAAHRAAMAKHKRRRRVPAAVRRAVFERDGGQCTFVDEQGRRCGQRHFLEFDHIDAHALGGTETVTNLRLRCRMHNALEAERLFGRGRVKKAIKHTKQGRMRRVCSLNLKTRPGAVGDAEPSKDAREKCAR